MGGWAGWVGMFKRASQDLPVVQNALRGVVWRGVGGTCLSEGCECGCVCGWVGRDAACVSTGDEEKPLWWLDSTAACPLQPRGSVQAARVCVLGGMFGAVFWSLQGNPPYTLHDMPN